MINHRRIARHVRVASLVAGLAAVIPATSLYAQTATGAAGTQTTSTAGTTYDDTRDDDRGGFPWGLLGLLGLAGLMGRKRDERTVHVRDDRPVGDRGTTGRP